MRPVLLTAALVSFLVYGYAIKKLFSREFGVDRRMKFLQLAGAGTAIVHLWSIWRLSVEFTGLAVTAMAAYLLALAIFLSARKALAGYKLTLAFSPDIPEQLIVAGIYSRIRHPFYSAYTLTWVGGVLAAPGVWTGITTLVMAVSYWCAARNEEGKFGRSGLGPAYAEYRRRAGMFFPVWR